jgi:hypothetical protein
VIKIYIYIKGIIENLINYIILFIISIFKKYIYTHTHTPNCVKCLNCQSTIVTYNYSSKDNVALFYFFIFWVLQDGGKEDGEERRQLGFEA